MVPLKSYVPLLAGIFLLFTAFGFVLAFFSDAWWYVRWTILFALISGVFAIGYAHAGFRRIIWLIVLMVPLQIGVSGYFSRLMTRRIQPFTSSDVTREAVHQRLKFEGVAMMFTIILGYTLIVYFVRAEGQRVFGPLTEVKLARDVHQRLVPEVSQTLGSYEFYGMSAPSGEVGGDLVDVVAGENKWIAYVADVCGHGVPAGMMMAMVKSAIHTGSAVDSSLPAFLARVNRVLKELSAPGDFVTFVCFAGEQRPQIEFSLGGHHPALHYCKKSHTVKEVSVPNPPLAIFAEADFATSSITCDEGDMLAIVTDGLTEAADKKGNELGLEPLKKVLLESAGSSLKEIAEAFRAAALRQGKQVDDQTVLLVRRL